MKIIVDENITFGKEAFSTLGDVTLVHGRSITNEILRDADALVVRSITNVNEALLKNTCVKFVGTATIGTDHIDHDYLERHNIAFTSAAGCNSHAVKEFVFNAILTLCVKHDIKLESKSLGIIGVGNIGSKVSVVAETMGLKVVKNDPPLQRQNPEGSYSTLEEALQCDFITFHVPLNKGGIDNTVHLLNESNLGIIKPGAVLINSSRGPVVDNAALKARLKNKNDIHVVLDVWETEPVFDKELLPIIEFGSPHIAGYSLEGKVNGTVFVYDALCKHLGIDSKWAPVYPALENNLIKISDGLPFEKTLLSIFNSSYLIKEDDDTMRKTLTDEIGDIGKYFDSLRKNYRYRRELLNYKIAGFDGLTKYEKIFSALRLNY